MNTNSTNSSASTAEKIKMLAAFKEDIANWYREDYCKQNRELLRTRIRQNVSLVRSLVAEAGCLKLVSTNPPSTSGLVVRDCDPFINILNIPYGSVGFIATIFEGVEGAIEVFTKSSQGLRQ